ncbi:MAG: divergent polysaccharide deacetylase family protein [Rhodospirillales bacterium]|nr:divergent polysaccharide deacetylase family protein [Rhodospirillales bacterium]
MAAKGAGAKKRSVKRKPRSLDAIPRWLRILAPAVAGAIAIAFGVGLLVAERKSLAVSADIESPPARVAAKPVLPHDNGTAGRLRPYEEPLPKDVYDAARVPAPPPASAPPEQAASVVPARPSVVAPEAKPAAMPPAHLPAWQRFAVAPPEAGQRPMIAIVIDDMGIDVRRSTRAATLPGPLTLSFLTYADDLDRQTAAARAHGHELMLHVPMEPESPDVDAGPNVLLTAFSPKEILQHLTWALGRFDRYVGINNHMGSKFTRDAGAMRVVMEELKRRGLLFLDSRTASQTVGAKLARKIGVPFAERNVFLDHDDDEPAIRARLAETEKVALRNGYAVAIGHPRDATLNVLSDWLSRARQDGFVLVPLSAIAARHAQGG